MRRRYEADGFLVIPGFKSGEEIAALRARAAAIVDAFDPRVASGMFTTRATRRRGPTTISSSPANACAASSKRKRSMRTARCAYPKALSINKIGHAMHDLDPVFERFSHGAALDALVRGARHRRAARLSVDVHLQAAAHRRRSALASGRDVLLRPSRQSVITLWFALERADRNNGCLWVQRGGHRTPLRERFVVEDGVGQRGRELDATPWPSRAEAEPLEVEPGTLVVFHGRLPHYSAPNRSDVSRHAYTLHVVDGGRATARRNWLQRDGAFPARGFA